MKYIFFLGKTPALSLAELSSMLRKFELEYKVENVSKDFAKIDIEQEFNLRDFFVQIGGIIKVSREISIVEEAELEKAISEEIQKLLENNPSKKNIAYSLYFSEKLNKDKANDTLPKIRRMFYEIKNKFSENNSLRILELQENTSELSSATIFNNKLTNPKKGAEFDLIFSNGKISISKTVTVQDIESYSMRDYEKPGKDARIGMMPPKLAQAMINLAEIKAGQTILDPFCGTGTILQEALLNDYRVIGSDANGEQIDKCKQNLTWISKKYIITYPEYKVFQSGFSEAMRKIDNNSIDAIVTECTLGPIYKKIPKNEEIRTNYNTLKKLYTRLLGSAQNVLKSHRRIVVTLPAYQIKPGEFVFAEFIDSFEKLGYSIVCPLGEKFKERGVKITKRNTIVYSRPDQIVAREIVILEKNK